MIGMREAVLASVLTASLGAPDLAATAWPADDATPVAVAVTGDQVYVADVDGDRVRVLGRDGRLLREWGGSGEGPGRLRGPAGIAIGLHGTVLVAESGNRRIQVFSGDGEALASWPAGAAPTGIATDAAGDVYVTDLDEGVVRRWSAEGTPRASWSADAAGGLRDPWGIAIASGGDVFVADHGHDRIVRFSSEGEVVGAWGARGREPGRLFGPMGVALARDGSVLVTDLAGARVQRFSPEGEPRGAVQLDVSGEALLTGIAVAGDAVIVPDAASGRIAGSWFADAATFPAREEPVTSFRLLGIEPVPSPGPVRVRLLVPARGTVSGAVFAPDGRRIATLPAEWCEPGERVFAWDGRTRAGAHSAAGVYHMRLELVAGGTRVVRHARAVVLR